MKKKTSVIPVYSGPVKRTIVLISGKARYGKDTFADGLVEISLSLREDGHSFIKRSFASNLKKVAKYLSWNGVKETDLEGNHNDKGRLFLQDLGESAVKYNRNVWVELLIKDLEEENFPSLIAISDCRYEHEISLMSDWGKQNGYEICLVRIESPGFDNGLSPEAKKHKSETSLDNVKFDLVIENTRKGVEEYKKESFISWVKQFPHIAASITGNWVENEPKTVDNSDGIDRVEWSSSIAGQVIDLPDELKEKKPKQVDSLDKIALTEIKKEFTDKFFITIDFDDTLKDKTGLVNRIPFFKKITEAGIPCVILTARSNGIREIAEFLKSNGIPAKHIIFNSRDKPSVIEFIEASAHFDDDPAIAVKTVEKKLQTPVFTMGEFASEQYMEKWVEIIKEKESQFYTNHTGVTDIEHLAMARCPLGTASESTIELFVKALSEKKQNQTELKNNSFGNEQIFS